MYVHKENNFINPYLVNLFRYYFSVLIVPQLAKFVCTYELEKCEHVSKLTSELEESCCWNRAVIEFEFSGNLIRATIPENANFECDALKMHHIHRELKN